MAPVSYPGIDERHGPRGLRYRVRVQLDGATHTRSFLTLPEAVAWRAHVLATGVAPAPVPRQPRAPRKPRVRAVTVSDAARDLCRGMVAGTVRTRNGTPYKPSVIRKYESALRLVVLPRIGELPVGTLRRGDVQRLVDEIAAERTAEHARKALIALRVVLRLADRDGHIDTDVCRGVRAPSDPAAARPARILTPPELAAIVRAAEVGDRRLGRSFGAPFLALMAFTGLRVGEALALPWGPDGVDLEDGCVRVKRAIDRVPVRGVLPFIEPKSRASRREVPIGAELAQRLREHRLACGRPPDGTLVFTDDGTPLQPSAKPRRAFQRAVREAGIAEPLPKLHDLRHAYASALLAAGLTVHAVADLLGHASPHLVMARYGHAYRDEVRSAGARLETFMASQTGRGAA